MQDLKCLRHVHRGFSAMTLQLQANTGWSRRETVWRCAAALA
jgi:hypothetical protein